MHRLAFDTSTPSAVLALERGDGRRFVATTDPDRRHGRELIPAIRDMLRNAGLSAKELQAVGVGLGPGSYTGLRVGVTAAKALAFATGAGLFGFDSLELFARSLKLPPPRVLILSDAQRGDFHVAEFRGDEYGTLLNREETTRILSAAEILAIVSPKTVVAGPGLIRWREPWPAEVEVLPQECPDPGALLESLGREIEQDRSLDPIAIEPIYLRRSAAEDQWTAKRPTSDPGAPRPSNR